MKIITIIKYQVHIRHLAVAQRDNGLNKIDIELAPPPDAAGRVADSVFAELCYFTTPEL